MTKYTDKNGRTWNKGSIQELLDNNDIAAVRALMLVYRNQTSSEQMAEETIINNGIGFTGADGRWLSILAGAYMKYGRLSPKQMAHVHHRVRKYWNQVLVGIKNKDQKA